MGVLVNSFGACYILFVRLLFALLPVIMCYLCFLALAMSFAVCY